MRYPITRRAVDIHGNGLAGATFRVYPFTDTDTWYSESAASGDWTVVLASLPAEVTVFENPSTGNTTTTTLISQTDGTTQVGWLPAGQYVIVAQIDDGQSGTRYFVEPGALFGPDVLAASGDYIASGDTTSDAIAKLDAALAAINARLVTQETEIIIGQFLGSASTFAGLSNLNASDRSPGDIADLTVDEIGTGTAESPQYAAGRYKVQPDDSFAFDRAYGEATAAVEEVVLVTTSPLGNSVPNGAKIAIDTVTGREYYDDSGTWAEKIQPAETSDPSTMTFTA